MTANSDTVYCHTDEMALGVVAALKAAGEKKEQ